MTTEASATSGTTEGRVKVNGADLYHQVRGSGPPVLMIHGTCADSGCYDRVAERLAGDFRVLTYDRRGWTRSPRPTGWVKTSIEEQADDAAWLLKATKNAPATVFGSSSGGLIALDLALRHADVVQSAVVHEPSMFTVLPQDFVRDQFEEMNSILGPAVAEGGPRGGLQTFISALAGEDGIGSLSDSEMLERWLRNAEFWSGYEFPSMLLGYHPDPSAIAALEVRITVMRAADSMPINAAAADWLAAQLKTAMLVAPGPHLAYFTRPDEFAQALRPVLAKEERKP